MAEKTTLLLLAALRKALAAPDGLSMHAARGGAGLFPHTAAGRQAAQQALDEGLLRPGKTPDLYTLSDEGLAWLLGQASPRQVLDDLVRVLEARESESAALLATARRMQAGLDGLRARAEQVLRQLPGAGAGDDWKQPALDYLEKRQSAEDCPLPELFAQARRSAGGLTIGGFHDGLRDLHSDGAIYLHPWTGPLYALPEPPLALLIGHEIAYYASPRRAA